MLPRRLAARSDTGYRITAAGRDILARVTHSPRTVRRAAGCALAVLVSLVAAVSVPASESRVTGEAYAVRVIVPGAQTSGTGSSTGGSYAYRDLVSVGSYSTGVEQTADRAYAHAELSSVSLLDGLVQVSSVSAKVFADGRTAEASGAFDGGVGSISVAGAGVGAGRFEIPGIGYGSTSEQREISHGGAAFRGAAVGLRVHLSIGWHDLPAGTEVVLGYADAGARAKPAAPTPAAPQADQSPVPAERGAEAGTTPAHDGAAGAADPSTPAPSHPAGEPDGTGFVPAGVAGIPPGGWSANPPIAPERRAQLLSSEYVFPVAGGATFSNDWGGYRADTGFHQGIDLFSACGTPLVAVHEGTVGRMGWNSLGGRRIWINDTNGNSFYYAHMSAYNPVLKEGMHVAPGTIVGYMGNTGDAQGTPCHLHLQVHPGGGWAVPPFDYVSVWLNRDTSAISTFADKPVGPPPVSSVVELPGYDISSGSGLDADGLVAAADGPQLALDELLAIPVPEPAPSSLLAPDAITRAFPGRAYTR